MPDLKLSVSRKAQNDLQGIWVYTVETWSVELAETYLQTLQSKFDLLCATPMIAREHTEFSRPIRVFRHGHHLIIYDVSGDQLRIVRVLHASQDWQAILS